MKTTIKLALLTTTFLLALAGCKNNFNPTNPSPDSFAKNVENGNVKNSAKLKYMSGPTLNGRYKDESYRVAITFSVPVDLKSAKDAITFTRLKPVANSTDKAILEDSSISRITVDESIPDKDTSKIVYFKFPKDEYDKVLFMKIEGSMLKAAGSGQKMDQDEDGQQGESNDDNYGKVFKLDGTSITGYGKINYLKYDNTLGSLFFSAARSFKRRLDSSLASDAQFGSLVTHIVISNRGSGTEFKSVEDYGISADDFKTLVQKHVVVEQYEDNKWSSIGGISFNYLNDTTSQYDKYLVSSISVKENVPIRARLVNIHEIKAKSTYYSYELKYTQNATSDNSVVLVAPVSSGKKPGYELGDSTLSVMRDTTKKQLTVIFTVPQTFYDAYYDADSKSLKNVDVNKTGNFIDEYQGFDTTTLTKDNFVVRTKPDYHGVHPTITGAANELTYTSNQKLSINGHEVELVLKRSSQSLSNGEIIIKNIDSFANSNTNMYYADTVNSFIVHYDIQYPGYSEWSADNFYRELKGLYDEVVAKKKAFEAVGEDSAELYYKNPLTKKFYENVELILHDNDATRQFVHTAVKAVVEAGRSMFEAGGEIAGGQITHQVSGMSFASSDLVFYVAPKVKVAQFKGHVQGDPTNKVTIGPLDFKQSVDTLSDDDPLLNDGWLKVNIAP